MQHAILKVKHNSMTNTTKIFEALNNYGHAWEKLVVSAFDTEEELEMFYWRRRVILALIICCLVMLFGEGIKNSNAVVLPKEIAKEASQIKEPENENAEAEVIQAVAVIKEHVNQYGEVKLQEAENINEQILKENIIMADRGGYKLHARVPQYNLSDEEFNLMARVVEAEAGGEPYEGQIAVANVIFNRVKAGWAKTVTEAITQKGQFTKVRKKPSDSVKQAVKEALYGRNAVPEGTLFFQNLDISTDFTVPNDKQYVTKIGMHTFYR